MEEKKETRLHRVQQDGLFGYADENGNVVIPCEYMCAEEFKDGIACVNQDSDIDVDSEFYVDVDSEFYIDKNGNFIEFAFWDHDGTKSKVMAKARMLAEQGKYDEAIECLKPETEHEEITTTAREELVHYLYKAKRYDEVIQWCKVTLEEWMNDPNRFDPESNLFSDYEWAAWKLAEMYEKGVGVKQDMLEAFINYDLIVGDTKNEDAIKKVKEILEKYPQLREEMEVQSSDSVLDLGL